MTSSESSSEFGDDSDARRPSNWLPHVRYTTSWYTSSPVDVELPCTATEDETCQIVHHLPVWNELLYCIHYELRPSSAANGQLSLVSLGQGRRHRPTAEDFMDWYKANRLLRWLLISHHCIDTLELSYWDVNDKVSLPYDHLFCDAFRQNRSIKALSISFSRTHRQENVCALIASAVRLERLECDLSFPVALSSALASLLRATTSLSVLKIGPLRTTEEEAHGFLAALLENTTLKELSMHEPYNATVSLLNSSKFSEYLKNSTTLTTLSLMATSTTCFVRERWWLRILEGISESTKISKVILRNLVIGRESAPIIAKILEKNATIRSFSMSSLKKSDYIPLNAASTFWLIGFVQNKTIEEVTLDFHMLSMMGWKTLFTALSKKTNVAKVTVKVCPRDHNWLPQLFRVLREVGAEEKVVIEAGNYFIGDRRNMLECKAFSGVYGLGKLCTAGDICRALQQIPSLDHLTCLLLLIPAVYLDDSLASYLSQCIKMTTSLRKLRLTTTWGEVAESIPDCAWNAVVSSLHENISLEEIFVAAVYIRDEDIECLADAVRFSTVLRSVEFVGEDSYKVDVFYRRLATNIAGNYSLQQVNFLLSEERNTPSFKPWYAVWEVARRNRDLLELAAVFVKGIRSDRTCACALEKVAHLPAFTEKVASMASVRKTEAAVMIRLALSRLKPMNEFMRLAGVVRDNVTCHPMGDGRMQLHDLNDYCWSSVRRYLSLDDVKYRPGPEQDVGRVSFRMRALRLHSK